MISARELWLGPPGGGVVVRGLSLCVARGEWLAITGPNGSGKTTLALALAGLVPPARGVIEVDGAPLVASPEGRRAARIAAVLQEPSSQLLQPTVADELAFTARNLGLPEAEVRERVAEWAARLGLEPDLDRDPHALSAGRQQLVLLGAALASRPGVLVVDEGGAHWDPSARARALAAVGREATQGMSVAWVTQEPDELRAAGRTLALAGPRLEVGWPDPAPGARSEVSVVLDVAPWDGVEPRSIRTSRPLRIECGPGRATAVRGPNGAGKTVLLEAAVGLRPTPQVRVRRVGPGAAPIMAGQHAELEVFAETVEEEMTFAARARGVPRERARRDCLTALEAVGYGSDILSRRVWDLSSGERRLVQVLAAATTPAGLVALDEPTCGLDRGRRAVLADWLRRRSLDCPVLVASQDLDWLVRTGAESVSIGPDGM